MLRYVVIELCHSYVAMCSCTTCSKLPFHFLGPRQPRFGPFFRGREHPLCVCSAVRSRLFLDRENYTRNMRIGSESKTSPDLLRTSVHTIALPDLLYKSPDCRPGTDYVPILRLSQIEPDRIRKAPPSRFQDAWEGRCARSSHQMSLKIIGCHGVIMCYL